MLITHQLRGFSTILTLTPSGGQILNWQVISPTSGKIWESLYQGSSPKRTGIPILFPFANPQDENVFELSGRAMEQHSFGRNSNWDFTQLSNLSAKFTLTQATISGSMRQAYRFQFQVDTIITITSPTTFSYSLQVTNLSDDQMPIAPGLHPYFPIEHQAKNGLIVDEIPESEAASFAWESDLNGNFYNYNGQANLGFPNSYSIQITELTRPRQFEHSVIWSRNASHDDSNFVCFEPFTRGTNALNQNPIIIQPNHTWTSTLEFKIDFPIETQTSDSI